MGASYLFSIFAFILAQMPFHSVNIYSSEGIVMSATTLEEKVLQTLGEVYFDSFK